MGKFILRPNAIPVYGFFSFIDAIQKKQGVSDRLKILDCGAGGAVPPLALFEQHGFDAWGIDVSDEQLDRARRFCAQHDLKVNLRKGDMRKIPFDDESFDYVYEHYSMCHLSKKDTAKAVSEMHRVLKRQGLCSLGVISADCWPKSLLGIEREPGEYWTEEDGESRSHSLFTDYEVDQLLSDWEIISKEKITRYIWRPQERISLEEWINSYPEAGRGYTKEAWRERYESKGGEFQYVHLHYCLKKP